MSVLKLLRDLLAGDVLLPRELKLRQFLPKRFALNPGERLFVPRIGNRDFVRSISANDTMLDPRWYFYWGAWSLECVNRSLEKLGNRKIESMLDLPCGHGRALRFFQSAFPDARLTACDIDKDGVDFCAETFGAKGVYSSVSPSGIELAEKFDLIWCGSLLTHLDQDKWKEFLAFFSDHLSPDGVLVFTTHGNCIIDQLRKGRQTLGLPPVAVQRILKQFDRTGFGYSDYANSPGFGISLSSGERVRSLLQEIPRLRLVDCDARGWGSAIYHHDAYTCVLRDDAASE